MAQETPPTFGIHSDDLRKGLRAVRHAVGDGYRPILASVCLEGDDKGVRLVAADNYRVAVFDLIDASDVLEQPEAMALGRRPISDMELRALDAWLASCGGSVIVTAKERTITFAAGSRSLTVATIDGTFPEWPQVFPDDDRPGVTVAVNPKYLAEAAKAAATSRTGTIELVIGKPWEPVLLRVPGAELREVLMPIMTQRAHDQRLAEDEAAKATEPMAVAS